jgi:hypothetical protein
MTTLESIKQWAPSDGIGCLLSLLLTLPETERSGVKADDIAQAPLACAPVNGLWGLDSQGLGLIKEPTQWLFRIVQVASRPDSLIGKWERRKGVAKSERVSFRVTVTQKRKLLALLAQKGMSVQRYFEGVIKELIE